MTHKPGFGITALKPASCDDFDFSFVMPSHEIRVIPSNPCNLWTCRNFS